MSQNLPKKIPKANNVQQRLRNSQKFGKITKQSQKVSTNSQKIPKSSQKHEKNSQKLQNLKGKNDRLPKTPKFSQSNAPKTIL